MNTTTTSPAPLETVTVNAQQQIIKDKLYEIVTNFISEQQIGGSEAVYQNDNVILEAPAFIEKLCEVRGYWDWETEQIIEATP